MVYSCHHTQGSDILENQDKCLEAARIIANCKPSRLPYVLAALKQGGIDVGGLSVLQAKEAIRDGRSRWLRSEREDGFCANWETSYDETALALRKAYSNGLNISKFSHACGIGRTTLYKILQTGEISTPAYRKSITIALQNI